MSLTPSQFEAVCRSHEVAQEIYDLEKVYRMVEKHSDKTLAEYSSMISKRFLNYCEGKPADWSLPSKSGLKWKLTILKMMNLVEGSTNHKWKCP